MKKMFEKLRRSKAFSLTEVLIVIALIGILTAVAFIAVGSYQRSMHLKEMDATAKELFIAAQNHLSMAEGQGFLGITKFGTEDSEGAVPEVRYLLIEGGDAAALSDQSSVLSFMLPVGSIDDGVRTGGNYIIRYQKEPARILDVFYAESSGKYAHAPNFNATEYIALLANSDASYRKNYSYEEISGAVIGYYGGALATGIPVGSTVQTPLLSVENGDVLRAVVSWKKADTNEQLSLVLKGRTSGAEMSIIMDQAGTITGTKSLAEPLDDISKSGKHFKDLIGSALFKPGEDLEIYVTAVNNTVSTNVAKSTTIITNSLFASVSGEDGDKTSAISSIRHLENLDPTISSLDVANIGIKYAVQESDLFWAAYAEAVKGTGSADEVQIYDSSNIATNATDPGCYMPISPDYLTSYDGKGHTIEGIKVVRLTGDAGLFAALDPASGHVTIKNLKLVNFNISASAGNVGTLAGTLSNASLSEILVHNTMRFEQGYDGKLVGISDADLEIYAEASGKSAGGLVGSLKGSSSAERCAASVYVESKGGAAGGLIGSIEGSASVTGCYSGGHTKEGEYTDETGYDLGGDKIYSEGRINVRGKTFAGGLIGSASSASGLTATYSYSTCSVRGATPGGFIGHAGSGTITDCYSAGKISSTENPSSFTPFAGAWSGSADDRFDRNQYLSGMSDIENDNPDVAASRSAEDSEIVGTGTAHPYDPIVTADNIKGSVGNEKVFYTFKNVAELGAVLGGDSFVSKHYGDWQMSRLEPLEFAVNNGDELLLEITLEDKTRKIMLAASGEKSTNTIIYLIELSGEGASRTVSVKSRGSVASGETSIQWDTEAPAKAPKLALAGNLLTVTLDSITQADMHFSQLFGSGANRLFAGENIEVRAASGKGSWKALEKLKNEDGSPLEKKTNGLFADNNDNQSGASTPTAHIKNIRHLQNLEASVSAISNTVASARLETNIIAANNAFTTGTYKTIYLNDGTTTVKGSFIGIASGNIKTFYGNNKKIEGLVVDAGKYNTVLSAAGASAEKNAGLFRIANTSTGLTINNLQLNECSFKAAGNGHVASAVAEANAGLTLQGLIARSEDKTVNANGSGCAGGLVGYAGKTLTIENSIATMLVRAQGPAGGLVGKSADALTVTASYAGGHTTNAAYDISELNKYNIYSESVAGGLVGEISGTGTAVISYSFSAASVATNGTDKPAGGLIGKVDKNVAISNAYVIAPVSDIVNQAEIANGRNTYASGAFVGAITSGKIVTNEDTYYLPEIYPGNQLYANETKSSVPYVGNSAQNDSISPVGIALYSKDDTDNAISIKNLQLGGDITPVIGSTEAYDSELKRDTTLGTREYPFIVWTAGGNYYGDWQMVLNKATVMCDVKFYKYNASTGAYTLFDAPSGGFQDQQIRKGETNTLDAPTNVPIIYNHDFVGWTVMLVTEGNEEQVGEIPASINASKIQIPANLSVGELRLKAKYNPATNIKLYFLYDRTGGNTGFITWAERQLPPGSSPSDLGEDKPARPIVPGYIFEGWYDNSNYEGEPFDLDSNVALNGDLFLYAKFRRLDYKAIRIEFKYMPNESADPTDPANSVSLGIQPISMSMLSGTPNVDQLIVLPESLSGMTPRVGGSIFYLNGNVYAAVDPISGTGAIRAGFENSNTNLRLQLDEVQEPLELCVIYKLDSNVEQRNYYVDCILHNTNSNGSYSSSYDTTKKIELFTTFKGPIGSLTDVNPEDIAAEVTQKLTQAGLDINGYTTPSSGDIKNIIISSNITENTVEVHYKRRKFTLSFKSDSSFYIEPELVYYGAALSGYEPGIIPEKTGYTFDQWILTKKGDSGTTLSGWDANMPAYNVEVAAKWKPGNSSYTVIFWQQNVNDDKNCPDTDKTYDYVESEQRSGKTGNTINLLGSDKNKSYIGFHYSSFKASDAAIRGDGTSVLNVYYDRNLITINYLNSSRDHLSFYQETEAEEGTQYGKFNDIYVKLRKTSSGWEYEKFNYIAYEDQKCTIQIYRSVTNNTGTQYGVVDGQLVQLTYNSKSKKWYYNDEEYTDTRYRERGSNWPSTAYCFHSETGKMETLYLYWGSYYYSYDVIQYHTGIFLPYNSSTGTGKRYFLNESPFTGLYGQEFGKYGYSWPQSRWKKSDGSTLTFLGEFILNPTTDTVMTLTYNGDAPKPFYYYLENVNGGYSLSDKGYSADGGGTFTFTEKYNGFSVYQYADSTSTSPPTNSNSWTTITARQSVAYSNYLHIRYKRNNYNMDIVRAYVLPDGKIECVESDVFATREVMFGKPLSEVTLPNPVPGSGKENYQRFDLNWYKDPACTEIFDLNETMPANNVRLYVKFELPRQTVNFYKENPTLYPSEPIWRTFTPYMTGSIANRITDAAGELLPEYILSKEGWDFLGWFYMDGATEKPFIYSMAIANDMTVYAKWKDNSPADAVLTIKYLVENDGVWPENLAAQMQDVVRTDLKVGDTLLVTPKEVEGYYSLQGAKKIVMASEDETFNFIYRKATSWSYNVEYYVRYPSVSTDVPLLIDGAALQPELNPSEFFKIKETTTYQTNHLYTNVSYNVQQGFENFSIIGYECVYDGNPTNTVKPGFIATLERSKSVVGQTPTVRFYLEPDPNAVPLNDVYVTYDGENHTMLNRTVTSVFADPNSDVSTELINIYVADDASVIDVNTNAYGYNAKVFIVMKLTQGNEDKYYLLKANAMPPVVPSVPAHIVIEPRSVTIKSASGSWPYDGKVHTKNNPLTVENGGDITIAGDRFAQGEGAYYFFSASSFRKEVGRQENIFEYEFWKGNDPDHPERKQTKASNYIITIIYGTLTVTP